MHPSVQNIGCLTWSSWIKSMFWQFAHGTSIRSIIYLRMYFKKKESVISGSSVTLAPLTINITISNIALKIELYIIYFTSIVSAITIKRLNYSRFSVITITRLIFSTTCKKINLSFPIFLGIYNKTYILIFSIYTQYPFLKYHHY